MMTTAAVRRDLARMPYGRATPLPVSRGRFRQKHGPETARLAEGPLCEQRDRTLSGASFSSNSQGNLDPYRSRRLQTTRDSGLGTRDTAFRSPNTDPES